MVKGAVFGALLFAARLGAQSDGVLDPSFGGGDGLVVRESSGDLELTALAASDDRLFAVGESELLDTGPHLHWWAVDPAGVRDPLRSCEGISSTTFDGSGAVSSRATSAWVDRSGRLVVAGSISLSGSEDRERALVARFDVASEGCVPDATFSTDGWATFDSVSWCDPESCEVLGLVEQTPESGAVAASRYVGLVRAEAGGFGLSRLFLLGLTQAGEPDATFDGNGWLEIDHPDFGAALFPRAALDLDARGRIYVLLSHSDADETLDVDLSVLRYEGDGELDTTFAAAGRLAVSDSGPADAIDAWAGRLVVDPDGSIFLSYIDDDPPTHPANIYTRRASDGELQGYLLGGSVAPELVRQSDGRLLSVKDLEPQNPVDGIRANAFRCDEEIWGYADLTFGSTAGSIETYDVDLGGDEVEKLGRALLWHGKLVLGGWAATDGANASFLIQTANRYIFADGFEGATTAPWVGVVP